MFYELISKNFFENTDQIRDLRIYQFLSKIVFIDIMVFEMKLLTSNEKKKRITRVNIDVWQENFGPFLGFAVA